jgi:hypothetical protein
MSGEPHIKATSTNITNFNECNDTNIENFEFCGLGIFCDMYKTKSGCILRTDENARDWPCIWIIEEKENGEEGDGEIGKCISESNLNCSNLTEDFQCLYVNNKMLEGESLKCFWDVTDIGEKCKSYLFNSVCSNDYHYEIISSKCSMRECLDRRINSNLTALPCGSSDCFKDINGINGSDCVSICSGNYHYINDSDSGVCTTTLIDNCEDRKVNTSAALPCGSSNCFKDVNGINGSSCVSTCTGHYHYLNDSGECTTNLQGCTSRKVNISVNPPCGSLDCFKDIEGVNGSNCVSICGSNSKGIEGVCTSCGDINASNAGSCSGGNLTSCYYKTGEEKCVTNCGIYYTENNGICTTNLIER